MATRTIQVRTCDICGKDDRVEDFQISGSPGVSVLDVCSTHAAPLLDLMAAGRLRRRPGRKPAGSASATLTARSGARKTSAAKATRPAAKKSTATKKAATTATTSAAAQPAAATKRTATKRAATKRTATKRAATKRTTATKAAPAKRTRAAKKISAAAAAVMAPVTPSTS